MIVDDELELTPGLFGRLVSGVAGGLAGGVVFGVLMQMTGVIPLVAQLVGRESPVVGWAVHMSIAVFVGVTYALIFGLFAVTASISGVLGIIYGLVWWVLGGLTLMPLRLGMGLFVFNIAAWQSLAGHLAYGLALGVVYAVVAGALIRARYRRARRPLAAEPPAPRALPSAPISPANPEPLFLAPPPPAPAPPPPPPPSRRTFSPDPIPPSAPLGAGLTPLSPQARALRQRRPG
jgi:hypothetical protein